MIEERILPRTISSQHPDNVYGPPWLGGPVIAGDAEVEEVFYSWARLGCIECMWDAEGKDVDLNVVRKLYTSHDDFFREHLIGRDYFLTYRIPNPTLEISDRKIYFETLQSIPKHADAASLFYGKDVNPPVFEVILPFTKTTGELVRLVNTYQRAVASLGDIPIDYPDLRLGEVIGDVKPKNIEVIPLFEDFDSIRTLDSIISRFVELQSPRYMRVFIARSDPALNNGLVPATLLSMLSLQKISNVVSETGIPVHPIIGVGTMPFRGGLAPDHLETFLKQYGGFTTVTIQSAFRYDYPENLVRESIARLNNTLPKTRLPDPKTLEETILSDVVMKLAEAYLGIVSEAAPSITALSRLVPARRTRKLHVGAFSYSRRVGGLELPRAIPFACVFYSLGMPPEFIGLRAIRLMNDTEQSLIMESYTTLKDDLNRVAPLVSFENINMLLERGEESTLLKPLQSSLPLYMEDIQTAEEIFGVKTGPRRLTERKYSNMVNNFLISLLEGDMASAASELLSAAKIRHCLG
ncbi:MAG: phosphoenolpyruvate carboxylase [Nitrososphaerota archaeon]